MLAILVFTGNFQNLPLTVARRYQQKSFGSSVVESDSENGTIQFKPGEILVTSVNPISGFSDFGKIISVNRYVLQCQLFKSHFNAHYHAYEVEILSTEIVVVSSSLLPYYLLVTCSERLGKLYLCLRYSIF